MHKIYRGISLLICLAMTLSLMACSQRPEETVSPSVAEVTESSGVTETSKVPESSKYTVVAIMSTTDMHGKCWYKDVLTDADQEHNMLGVSTAVTSVREQLGRENVILIDNGDLFQGTPVSEIQLFQYGSGESQDVPVMALCLKEIGYDVFSPGNHEFNYNWDIMHRVYEWLDSNGVPVISANICYDGSDGTHSAGENVFAPYTTKTIKVNGNDHKIGILGLENTDIKRWDLPVNYPGITFVHPDNKENSLAKEAETYISQMQDEGCEFIIVSYHGGPGDTKDALKFGVNTENQGKRIIAGNTGIGMIIMGHDHTSTYSNSSFKDKDGHDIPVVNGGSQDLTKSVYRFSEDSDGKLTWELLSSENIILDGYKDDEELKKKVAPYAEIAVNEVSKPVGKAIGVWDGNTNYRLECTDSQQLVGAAVIDICTKKLKEKYQIPSDVRIDLDHLDIDLVMTTSMAVEGYAIEAGDISLKDIYKLYRYANNIIVIPMTGQEIKEIMEENASDRLDAVITDGSVSFTTKNDDYTNIIFGGLNFEYDLSKREGNRVIIDKFSNGRIFENDKVYLVAVNNYILGNEKCGLRDYSIEDTIWNQLNDTNGDIVQDIIAEYISSKTRINGGVSPSMFNWDWKIVYSAPASNIKPDEHNTLATYEKEPKDEKKYILYHEASGNALSSQVSGNGLAGAAIPTSGDYLTGKMPEGALEFTIFYGENYTFTLRDQNGNFLFSSPDGGLMLTNKPVEDRYQFWKLEKGEGGWILINVAATGDRAIEYYDNEFTTNKNTNKSSFIFNFYEVG